VKIEVPCFIQNVKITRKKSGLPEFFQNFFLLFAIVKANMLSVFKSQTIKNKIDK